MNQILSTSSKSNSSKKMGINTVVMMFSITLMVFGMGMSATGAYGFYKNLSEQMNNDVIVMATEPVITVERVNVDTINIVVTHDKGISTVTYVINNDEPVEILGDGQLEVKKEVKLQNGTSTISITAKDVNGVTADYETVHTVEKQAVISLEPLEGKIGIKVESEIGLSYVEYYWDDDIENVVREDVQNSEKTYETSVDVLEDEHTLNVKAVDVEGKEVTKTQKTMGDNKPQIKVQTDGTYFYITATDDKGLKKIEMTLNGGETISKEISGTECQEKVLLEDLDVNRIIVVVYNINDLSETARVQRIKK